MIGLHNLALHEPSCVNYFDSITTEGSKRLHSKQVDGIVAQVHMSTLHDYGAVDGSEARM